MKKKTAGERIIESMTQAIAYVEGRDVPGVRVTEVAAPDVKKVRSKLKLSQVGFATRFGFSPALVRNWEQGRNRPDGAARVLLAVIDRNPKIVEDAVIRLKQTTPAEVLVSSSHS